MQPSLMSPREISPHMLYIFTSIYMCCAYLERRDDGGGARLDSRLLQRRRWRLPRRRHRACCLLTRRVVLRAPMAVSSACLVHQSRTHLQKAHA
jgi:hypothetical protein